MAVKKMKLDFSKVEERSGYNTKGMPLGLHAFKVVDVHEQDAPDGTGMWVFDLVPVAEAFKAKRFPYYCKLQANQLWKLRDLFVAAGVDVPKRAVTLDPNKVMGKTVAGEVQEGTGNFSDRTEINGIYGLDILGDDVPEPADDEDDDQDEYDEPEGDEDSDDEVDDERAEELEGMTLPQLRKEAKSLGIDTAGLKKDDLIEAILEAEDEAEEDEDIDDEDEDLDDEDLADEDDEDYEDDEDEEEEEPEPAPRRRPAAKKPAAKSTKAAPAKRTIKRR